MENENNTIKAIIFGLEGSIITSENSWDRTLRLLLSEYGIDYNRVKLKPEMAGRTLKECAAELKKRYPEYIQDNEQEIALRIRNFLTDLIEKGLSYQDGFESFYDYATDHFKLAIATSMDEEVFKAVEDKLSFSKRYTSPIFFPGEQESKPSASLFNKAAEHLEVDKAHCLAIEDSPNGVLAARHADMEVIGLAGTFGKEELADLTGLPADKIFENYSAIREWLQGVGYSS